MQDLENTPEVRNTKTIVEEIALVTEESKVLYEEIKSGKFTPEELEQAKDHLRIMDESYTSLSNELRERGLLEKIETATDIAHKAEEILGSVAARGQDVRVPDPITGQPITMDELKKHNEAVSAGAIDPLR